MGLGSRWARRRPSNNEGAVGNGGDGKASLQEADSRQAPGSNTLGASTGLHGGRGRAAYIDRDLTTGSVPKNLWFLSWPQLLEGVFNILDQLADLLWAGRLGFRAIAGLGVAQTFTQVPMMVRTGMDIAMRAMISRAVGAGNIPLAQHIMLQGFTLSFAYILIVVGLGFALTDVLMNVIGVSEAIHEQGAMYMRVQFLGIGMGAIRMTASAALQAAGDVMTPMKSSAVARVVHIFLSPFLVFGWWWFPELGLPGAALANVLAQALGSGMLFYVLFTGRSRLHLTLKGYRLDFPLLWRMVKLGTPASVAAAERAVAQLVLLAFVTPFGDLAVAAYSITRRLETIGHVGSMAFGQASGILVGQNLGAGKPQQARQALRWGLGYVSIISLALTVLILLFPAALISIFNSEPELLGIAVVWLRIQALASLFMAPGVVYQQTFNTAGDTLAPLVVTLISFWGVQIPMAWLLSSKTGLGQFGIAWAIVLAMIARVALFLPLHAWGRWLRMKVI